MGTTITGEALHEQGRDGARRAKRWLDATSRVEACWVNPDNGAAQKLTFVWPQGGQSFSFDLGGWLRYGSFEGQMFFAEVKKYANASDLGGHYTEFLAKCYVAYQSRPHYTDHFMWVSWAPHASTRWESLTTPRKVHEAVSAQAGRIFPAGTDPEDAVDQAVCKAVSERLWLLILSDKQEVLVPTVEHLNLIHSHERVKAAGA